VKRLFLILFVCSCLFSTLFPIIGNELFMRNFLSCSYSLHILTLALIFITFLSFILERQKSPPPLDGILAVYLLWGCYIFFHNIFVISSEVYYQTYLLVGIAAFLCLNMLIKRGSLRAETLYLPIVITGIIEAVVVLLQALHISSSNTTFFLVTGTGNNPNIAAMIMCLSVPASVAWIKTKEKTAVYILKGLILLLLVAAILITRCRSAVLGLLVVLPFLFIRFRQLIPGKRSPLWVVVVPVLLLIFFLVINQQKLASSSGRLTIWKLSTQLIADKPITGYGYGYFEKNYNLHQAGYFNSGNGSEQEVMTAAYTGMAYNDVIEQTVMGGVVGGLLFLLCLLLPIWKGWKNRSDLTLPLSGVVIFTLMSQFNFTISHPILFLFFLLYVTVINGHNSVAVTSNVYSEIEKKGNWLNTKLNIVIVILAACIVFFSLPKYRAQLELTRADVLLKKGQYTQAGYLLRDIEPRIATSEAFYAVKANYLLSRGDVLGALSALQKRLQFTLNPRLLLDMAQLAFIQKEYALATSSLQTAAGIEPHKFRPKVMLMALYYRLGDANKAKQMATTIIRLKPKIDSREVHLYKKQAEVILAGKPVAVSDYLTINQ